MKKYNVKFRVNSGKEKALQTIKHIKDALNEQGVGGILMAKQLYYVAKVKPITIARNVTKEEAIKIAEALKEYGSIEICENDETV